MEKFVNKSHGHLRSKFYCRKMCLTEKFLQHFRTNIKTSMEHHFCLYHILVPSSTNCDINVKKRVPTCKHLTEKQLLFCTCHDSTRMNQNNISTLTYGLLASYILEIYRLHLNTHNKQNSYSQQVQMSYITVRTTENSLRTHIIPICAYRSLYLERSCFDAIW